MSSEIKIVEAPDCTCIRCAAEAPLRAKQITPSGTNVDGFRAVGANNVVWAVTHAERPEGWSAGARPRDLRRGLCAACTAAWEEASRAFLPGEALPLAPEPEPEPAPPPAPPPPSTPPPAPGGRRFFHASIPPQVRATPLMATAPRVLTPPPVPNANMLRHDAATVAPTPAGRPSPIVGSTIAQRVTVQPIRHDRIGVVGVAPRTIPPSETAQHKVSKAPLPAQPRPSVTVENRVNAMPDHVVQVAPAPSAPQK